MLQEWFCNRYQQAIVQLQCGVIVDQSKNKLKNYELQIEQANEAVSLANTRYKGGVITTLELLTAQTNMQDAQLGKIQLEYNLLLSKLDLNRIGGTKLW